MATLNLGACPEIDQRTPGYKYGYSFELPANADVHLLNELNLGYFASPTDPAGSDRPIRSAMIKSRVANTSNVGVGGPDSADFAVEPGGSVTVPAGMLSEVAVKNIGGGAGVIVDVLLIAMET